MNLAKYLVTLLLVISANANLIGLIENSQVAARFTILDFQRSDAVDVNITFKSGEGEYNEKSISFYLPVTDYIDIFNSEKSVSKTIVEFDTELTFKASGKKDNRTISFSHKMYDDYNEVAHQYDVKMKIEGQTANIQLKKYGRKVILFYVTNLKLRASNSATGINFKRDGICLYGDNLGHPLGRVISEEGLISAASDTSTQNLRASSEKECNQ